MRARNGRLGLMAAVAAFPLTAAVAALGAQTPAATYTGTTSGGGTVTVQVSADGNAVTRLEVDPGLTECGFHPLVVVQMPGIAIVNHAFTYSAPPWTVSGSFPDSQNARGNMEYRRETPPACTMAPRTWTATVATPTSTPTPSPTTSPTPTPTPTAPPGGPQIRLSGSKVQRPGRTVQVRVRSSASGSARATGRVSVRRPGRKSMRFTLGSATAELTADVTTRLRLAVSNRARRAIARALRSRGRVTATVKVTATDTAGNASTMTRTVRISL